MIATVPDRLYFTGSDEADELLARDPMALLVGFALDQQVPVPKAFSGPRVQYGGDAARVWSEAADTDDLRARLAALPGFGAMKVTALGAVLAKRFGVTAAEGLVPWHPTLGDVDSPEALAHYQAAKRAHKAEWKGAAPPAG
jgi:hypothetical protein